MGLRAIFKEFFWKGGEERQKKIRLQFQEKDLRFGQQKQHRKEDKK